MELILFPSVDVGELHFVHGREHNIIGLTNILQRKPPIDSIFQLPHTACSCFQNVASYIPELDGIALVHRNYSGEAPGGWTWSKLANNVAGYQNPDGFTTFATMYLKSSKFFQADGGYDRVVWMTSKLKTIAGDSIPEERSSRIATEKEATKLAELKEVLSSF